MGLFELFRLERIITCETNPQQAFKELFCNHIYYHGLNNTSCMSCMCMRPTYKTNKDKYIYTEWPFRDKEELTQFGRACQQLGIKLIYALSPQAKGRVERVFGTLQDRLTKELRLAKAVSCQEANNVLACYLDSFNRKFQVPARSKGDLHRTADKRIIIDDILSVQTERTLRNDRTVLHNNRWYQILNRTGAARVTIYEHLNGSMSIRYGNNRLQYKSIEGPVVRVKEKMSRPRIYKGTIPSKDHCWRIAFKPAQRLRSKEDISNLVELGHF